MKCINFRTRTHDYNRYFYCTILKKEIDLCSCNKCEHKIYKFVKPLRATKPLKKVSKKHAKSERERYSVFTDDLTRSIESKLPKDDLHEIYGGSRRANSIKWGLVIPLTRDEHNNAQIKQKWQIRGQEWFVKEYGYDKFMEVFKMDYIEKNKKRAICKHRQ